MSVTSCLLPSGAYVCQVTLLLRNLQGLPTSYGINLQLLSLTPIDHSDQLSTAAGSFCREHEGQGPCLCIIDSRLEFAGSALPTSQALLRRPKSFKFSTPPRNSCVILSKFTNLSEPHFLYWNMGVMVSTSLAHFENQTGQNM